MKKNTFNDKNIIPSVRYNNYTCTQQQSPRIHEAKPDRSKGEIDNSTIIVQFFST